MSISVAVRRRRGVSLVELLMFIVIISIAVVGVLQTLALTAGNSADPLRRKQALAIAEGLLEEVQLARFTFCDPSDSQADTATGAFIGAGGCSTLVENVGQEVAGPRPFDNVNDYVSAFGVAQPAFDVAGVLTDANLAPINVSGYTAKLTLFADDALGGIASGAAPAAMNVLRIRVEVFFDADSVVLEGYRVRYAPN